MAWRSERAGSGRDRHSGGTGPTIFTWEDCSSKEHATATPAPLFPLEEVRGRLCHAAGALVRSLGGAGTYRPRGIDVA
ncbi:hypothetical protein NDU88_006893 [Pleurodeles waltl]|uniref:Uncharacterized protein n=1 Tax=Pleurodeles waltl TaxID=8319 RepID=A0AAV7VQY0_PLEWA|nr:hypothetical protein NDU88_006893 [Pleurodeles waltl]